MILQKIKKSIEKIGIPCFLDYNDATSYCAVLIPETNGKESIKVDIQFIWEDGNPILLADKWIKSLRMNKELKAIVLGSENNYAGFVLRVKVIDVSICSYIPVNDTPKYNISIENDPAKGTVSGAGQYKEGKTCTISCTPFEQYYFDGWDKFVSGEDNWESDGTIYDNPYSFTVDQDLMFEAIYGNKYHVEVVSAGNGTVSGSGYYEPTETCTITATPNTGYHFVNWTVSGLELTTDNPYSFVPTGDITITANFAINTYTISTSGTGGTITGSGTYNYGATCTLTATANAGYEFRRWMEYGETISTSNPYSFTVNSDRTITADFNQLSYTVSATSSGNGSVSGGGTYHYGDSITLTATPDEGYAFVNWTEGGSTLSSSNPYTFSCTGNQTIVGNFEEFSAPLIINCSAPSSVILTNSSNQTYTLNLVEGENVYEGTEPGFALDEITGLKKGNDYYNLISIDATGLTSWTTIEQSAFRGENYKSNLESITLPNSITSIDYYAFYYCNSLISITLPASITSIGARAFSDCTGLASITCLATTPPTISNSFDYTNDCLIYVPVGYVDTYKTAWSSYASRIVGNIPEPTEDNLLVECKNTTSVILTNSSNQTYTWNLSIGKNYYTGTEPGFAINEITGLKRGNSNMNNIVSIDASDLTSWTTIGTQAFSNCQGLISITLPSSITSIGTQAFSGCNKLTSIILPEGLTTIESQAFNSCSKLTSINLPEGLTTIGTDCFSNCSSIVSLHFPSSLRSISGRFGYGFTSLSYITVNSNNQYYNDGNGSNCIIETSTNKLILGCKNTIIPNTVLILGTSCFHGATSLTSITLPDSITYIDTSAFSGSGLISITIPENVNYIGSYAFSISDLASITVDYNNTTFNDGNGSNCIIKTSTNTLIIGCKNTVIPNTVVEIGDYAFSNCHGLTSITIPTSVNRIGQYAFQSVGLANLVIPSSVNYVGNCAFWNNSNMSYIEFEGTTPATLGSTSIFGNSFPIYVPSSAVSDYKTAWSTYASRIKAKPEPTGSDYLYVVHGYDMAAALDFSNSNNETYRWTLSQGINYYNGEESGFAINEITGVKARGASGFSSYIKVIDASRLTSWTTIENDAFNGCSGLTSITLPDSITSIGNGSFNGCRGLTSITLPNSLISIDNSAFQSCNSLTSITCLSTTPPTLGGVYALYDTNNCPIYVPAASVNDYKTAPVWSNYSSRIQAIPTP